MILELLDNVICGCFEEISSGIDDHDIIQHCVNYFEHLHL